MDTLIAKCPYNLTEPLSGRYGREWFFDYPGGAPLARLILTGCGTSFKIDNESTWACTPGDAHYKFVADAIDGARGAAIPWVIVAVHKNCITAGSKACDIGGDFQNLLLQKKVDLILQAHDHLYERSKQLTCATKNSYNSSCVADNGTDGRYMQGNGSVLVIQGTGGHSADSFAKSDSEAGYFVKGFGTSYGFVNYTVSRTAISVNFVRSSGGHDNDSFVIEAAAAPPPGPSPPSPSSPFAGGSALSPSGEQFWILLVAVAAAGGSGATYAVMRKGPGLLKPLAKLKRKREE